MVYVIAELRNYRQLARLRAESLPGLESGLLAALGAHASHATASGQGVLLCPLGAEEGLDVEAAASVAFRLRDYLASRREELFGYTVLLAGMPEGVVARSSSRVLQLLEGVEEDERLWLASDCATLFADALSIAGNGPLYRVTGRKQAPSAEQLLETPRPWIREELVGKALDLMTDRLNDGESRDVVWVHGPPGVGKTALLSEVAARLLHAGGELPVLRMRTVFKRRSPLHPFLSSLQPSLLAAVPARLQGPEKGMWAEVGGLLSWLLDPAAFEQRGGAPLPDNILEDFLLGYRLYLMAWTRMAEERLLPAVFLCEGVDAYHPTARKIAAGLFGDLLMQPSFLPIVSSVSPEPSDELSTLTLRPLYVPSLGKREIRQLARHVFPGLEIPPSVARRLRRRSGGQYVSSVSYLHYLLKTGHVRTVGQSNVWVQEGQEEVVLPTHPLSVSWFLIRTLQDDTFLLLYALYLAGGLLDRQGFLSFLGEAGFDAATAGRTLSGLLSSGLMSDERALIPRFSALRRKLEELLGAEGSALRDRFITHMVTLWTSGRYRHPVLLFTFLARNGRTDLALSILPDIIRRKLDERDPAGARVFCEPRAIEFAVAPTPEQARTLAAVTALGRLRAALIEGNDDAAETAQAEALKWTAGEGQGELRGETCIERGKYFLSTGAAGTALEELKKGLLLYQEQRDPRSPHSEEERGERACYLWLGATMLAEGRLGEAVEYLGLSQRLCHEAGDAPGMLWTVVYLAVCMFIDGRYTQSLAAIDHGLDRARALYRREIELFLLFLQARIRFQLGSYEECSLCLQSCLCLATLYPMEGSLQVLRAWLGRTLLHLGEIGSGTKLLESLSEQTREVLLFQAEGALFSGSLENASLFVERGLARPTGFHFPSPEGVSWQDGFCSVEGRCFRMSREDAFLRRTLSGLRAYLQGLRGFASEGITELHQLTRGERAMDEDPLVSWFNFLYQRILPETGTEEMDDRLTVLSKSLKSLQARASRIDAPAERSSYLWRNRWNRMIMEDARERKLL